MEAPRIIRANDIPEGETGSARISKHTFEERTNVAGWDRPSFVPAGTTITMLHINGQLMMSNTPDEMRRNRLFVPSPDCDNEQEDGELHVLIGGLGLGLVLEQLQEKICAPDYDTEHSCVLIVESNQDVVDLVAPAYESISWLGIRQADIWTEARWVPDNFFHFAYMDIWGDYNTDLLPEMFKLRRLLIQAMRPGRPNNESRVQIWQEAELKRRRAQEEGL